MAADRVDVEVDGRRLSLSNLDKPLYADGFTKADVIHYYRTVAPAMLPHLRDRALTRRRFPDGTGGPGFFEKRAPSHTPDWVETVELAVNPDSTRWGAANGRRTPRTRIEMVPFVVAQELATLVWLANLACLELHTPMARAVVDADTPTMVVFDLDPGPPADAVDCARVALRLREILDQLGLACVVKSSGSKGLQAYVPLNTPGVTGGAAKDFALAVALLLEQRHPDEVVSTQAKDKRTGKVLVDWLQNESFKTTVCAYSLRALDHPTVSTPLTWDEVADLADAGDPASVMHHPAEVLERVARLGDLFGDAATLQQDLPTLA